MRLRRLFRHERTSGLLMLAAMGLGLLAANSPLAGLYDQLHHTPTHLRIGPLAIDEPLVRWINEGLMVIFFLLVGLEIKRQLLEGHLATPKCALLPGFAALGGMAVPAGVYAAINWGEPAALAGWAIPTATDIVLALGVLSLLGARVPTALRVFLTALAIFDDIGAVLLIGLFYGELVSAPPLALAGFALLGLIGLNRLGATHPTAYTALGLLLWGGLLEAGVEAALSGVLIALAVPLRRTDRPCPSPLRSAERSLQPWGALVVVPLFAFFNAGVALGPETLASLGSPVALGVLGGLVLGKQLGVFASAWLAVRLGLGALPAGLDWRQLYGAALLAGIGFTMSLFVTALAFDASAPAAAAKVAVLLGSLLSALAGLAVVHRATAAAGRPPGGGLTSRDRPGRARTSAAAG